MRFMQPRLYKMTDEFALSVCLNKRLASATKYMLCVFSYYLKVDKPVLQS